MNLIIDRGNTLTKAAIFNGRNLVGAPFIATDGQILSLFETHHIQHVLMASVAVPDHDLEEELRKRATLLDLRSASLPIVNKYQGPETLGQDRIAAAVGAHATFPEKNCLVIDAGTCITYEMVTASGDYLGGAISPGIAMRLKAMNAFTGRLPLAELVQDPPLIGTDTASCLQSGAINGAVAEVKAMVERYRQSFDDLNVILCGGDAPFFESKINTAIFAHPNLVPTGLNEILLFNIH